MPQGYIRVSEDYLKEIAIDCIDFAALKKKMLLPEHYAIDGLHRMTNSVVDRPFADLLVSASEIPEGAAISPMYQRTRKEDEAIGPYPVGYETTLVRIDIEESL